MREDHANEIKQLFFESAQELLQTLNEEAVRLEQRPDNEELIRDIRRSVHTLKGDSAVCGFREMSETAHRLEDALDPVRAPHDPRTAALILQGVDLFTSMLEAYRQHKAPPDTAEFFARIFELVPREDAISGATPTKLPSSWTEYERLAIDEAIARGQRVYQVAIRIAPECPSPAIAEQMLAAAFASCGEVLARAHDTSGLRVALVSTHAPHTIAEKCKVPAVTAGVNVQELGITAEPAAQPSEDSAAKVRTPALRVAPERVDELLNLAGELVVARSMLQEALSDFAARFPRDPARTALNDAFAFHSRLLNELHKSVMKVRMVPVEQLFRRVPRVVRDAARFCGKTVNVELSAGDAEVDKSVLDELSDSLLHLVRNAVDHGIEKPEERVAAGKTSAGTLRLSASHEGNRVVIEVADDGRGLSRDRLVERAIDLGLITAAEGARMSEAEARQLIVRPGFTTAERVTEISGRGIGMDAVRAVVDRLKGWMTIDSEPGAGTTVRIHLPLTLAIIRALLVGVAGRTYALPLESVQEITRIDADSVHSVEGRQVTELRGELLRLVRLRDLLGAGPDQPRRSLFTVIVSHAGRRYGIIGDELMGEEELVIKGLDDQTISTDLVSGASILGNGTVVLVLNVVVVIDRSSRIAPPPPPLRTVGVPA
jgi:two-component system chemotaxis sensor kinase CheA